MADTRSRRGSSVPWPEHSHSLATVRRSFEVLELVVAHPGEFNAKGLARRLGTSLSTTYHVINTLEDLGFVQVSSHGGLESGPAMERLHPTQ